MDSLGLEPRASALQRQRSSNLIYEPILNRFAAHESHYKYHYCSSFSAFSSITLGGDPAADSPTATLLRLNPTREAQVRTRQQISASSLRPHSHGLTGGVCKEQGRIHRAMLKRDYYGFRLHEDELQSSIRTTNRFRRLPSLFRVGAHCPIHCSPRVAQIIRGILTYRCPHLPPP